MEEIDLMINREWIKCVPYGNLAHFPKVCYKHNISTSDTEQNIL